MSSNKNLIYVIKSSGEKVEFSLDKLRHSLKRSGAEDHVVEKIVEVVQDELYQGITSHEIYNRAYSLLKKNKSVHASKYKLKKAIYELGPTGFPFERFIGSLLFYSGYQVEIGKIINGECVSHEVDIIANKNSRRIVGECKFHGEQGKKCNVKIPLYIHSRYQDILKFSNKQNKKEEIPNEGWVITNTRFTLDALKYGKCAGLYLLSWDYPNGDSIKDRIDRLGLYPITVSSLLNMREKQFLLSRNIVLCRQLKNDMFYLDHLGVSEKRKSNILKEINSLCKP